MIHQGSGAGSPSIQFTRVQLPKLHFHLTVISFFYFVLFKVDHHFQSQLSVHHLDEGAPAVLFLSNSWGGPRLSFTSKVYNDNRKSKLNQRCEFIKCHLLRVTFFTKHESNNLLKWGVWLYRILFWPLAWLIQQP